MDNIPEWMLWEVLVRLPCSKHVVRCKAISKQWASLISNPLFVRSYISRRSPSWTVIGRSIATTTTHDRRLTFLEYDLPVPQQHFDGLRHLPPPQTDASCCYEVFGTSNGLILFGLTKHSFDVSSIVVMDIYYLCNPVTGELISIPPSGLGPLRAPSLYWGPGLVTRVAAEDAVLESFRVVLLLTDAQAQGYLRFSVYASETVEWKEFVLPIEVPYGRPSTIPVTLDDRFVHWVTPKNDSVIAYDPYHHPDRMRVISPPPHDDDLIHCKCHVSVVGGKIGCFVQYKNGFKLWVLEDYYGSGSWWRLSHEASVQSKGDTLFPKLFHGDILFLGNERRLVSYELKTGKVREYTDDDGLQSLVGWSLAFSVQLSPWPISIKEIPNYALCSSPPATPNGTVGSSCKNFLDYFLSNLPDNQIIVVAACWAFVLFHS